MAEEYLRHAIELTPAFALGWCMRGFILGALRQTEATSECGRQARVLDADSAVVNYLVGHHLILSQNYAEAESLLRRSCELDANFQPSHMQLGRCLLAQGKTGEGLRKLEICARDTHDEYPYALGYLGYAYGQTGRWPEAEKILLKLKQMAPRQYTPAFAMALVNMGMDEKDQAMEYLSRAHSAGEASIATLHLDPNFTPLRGDPRFQELIRRIGMPV